MGLLLFAATGFSQKSFYYFTVKDIEGNNFDLSSLKGKKVLVVNTASKCGFTPQYEGLEKLYENYGGDKFTIIGFPANNFANQENRAPIMKLLPFAKRTMALLSP